MAAGLNRYAILCESICGILFLGTPFRGSQGTDSAHTLVMIASVLGKQTSHKLLEILNDDRLSEIRIQFCDHAVQKWGERAPEKVVCFYETEPTRITRAVIPSWAQGGSIEQGIQALTRGSYNFVVSPD